MYFAPTNRSSERFSQGLIDNVMAKIPTYDAFMNPIIQALRTLGGSGTIEEINAKVAGSMNLTNEQLELLHNAERGSQTEVEYRLAWARTYLKKYDVLENSSRGFGR